MRILFYLVHPAKFQFHKMQIKELRKRGHTVDIIINSKDVLEELVKEEGWEYTNLFPEGRKIKGLHVYLAAIISIFKTISRLLKYTKGKKYDLFVGDLLTILGRIKNVPSLYPTDDVIRQVPEQSIFLFTCNHIIAPSITELGWFNRKKVNYDGYKALTYLHPNIFSPSNDVIEKKYQDKRMFFIRCTGFGATHDIGRSGIDDSVLERLIELFKNKGEIVISSERSLPERFKKYEYTGKKNDVFDYIAYADLMIGDSVSMCTESALLGTPTVEYDNYWFEMEQLIELQDKYKLINLFEPPNLNAMLEKVENIINSPNLKIQAIKKRDKFIDEKINVNEFLVWYFENYPQSSKIIKKTPDYQYNFK